MKYIFLILCLLLESSLSYARRPMGPLDFELTSASSVYEQGAVMEFRLRITNKDISHTHSITLPGSEYRGRKFIYLTAHADDKHYSEIAREAFVGVADSAADLYNYPIGPGKHIDIRLKLYDKPRSAVVPSEPHWLSRSLAPGRYRLRAWYMPYEDLELDGRTHQGLVDKSGYNGHSNYLAIEIKPASKQLYGRLDHCPDDCSFCRHIEQGRWRKVRNAFEGRLEIHFPTMGAPVADPASRGYWLERHRNVAYISPLPNAIHASIPAYWGHITGFRSGDSIHYYNMTIQLGRNYHGRAQIQNILHWMFGNRILLRTSDADYMGLKYFHPIPAPDLFTVSSNQGKLLR